ncbi:flavodoxin domain-containing protein [Jannaschia pohangensis]|uniref:Menaquinone-dependent protoporphyrinogen oxidase n=1 Tax=Jannaschia pohangensis TaxID=390807 RepID=A0A1I3NZR3_9RHOB|nr:flavodoxin domain-containing protein [Jannaschia pohangensis]SFJ14784.1 menaquinone-dependent protoporphyrinogen oxidase [Jannaschia pohangensis]
MDILIVFSTVEGQTRKIADFIGQRCRSAGHAVHMFNTDEKRGAASFDGVDAVILAAPVHERRHPEAFETFVAASRGELKTRRTLLISVSLKASFSEGLEEAQDYLAEMEMRTGFEPDAELLAAGAVRTSSYGYFETQVVRSVVLNGRDIDLIDGVREFTDWDALSAAVDAFLQATMPHYA